MNNSDGVRMTGIGEVRLSVIVPSLDGTVPLSLREQVDGRDDAELVVVKGVSPVGRARNEGLARATGDYIAWVDADDEVADGWLDAILKEVGRRPDVIVVGYKWMTNAGSDIEKIWQGGDLLNDVLQQEFNSSELWPKVVRRELWDGVRFDDTARILEDWEVLPQVLMRAKKVVTIKRPLYHYYARSANLTHQTDESMRHEFFERAVGRIAEIKRLGLWKKYGRVAMIGVAYVAYGDAELLAFSGASDSTTKREVERWICRHLPVLLAGPARLTFKVKWVLASLGWWRVVRWYYVKIQGRKL